MHDERHVRLNKRNSWGLHWFKHTPTEKFLFLAGLVLKLIVGSIFVSETALHYFVPFLLTFIESPLESPYKLFFINEYLDIFPYPALALYLISTPYFLILQFLQETPLIALLSIRTMLFLADLSIYIILLNWLSSLNINRLIFLYWLNPITFYITYFHGQLDSISIALLMASMSFLFSKHFKTSALFFGCALSVKTSVLLALPVYFLYFLHRSNTLHKVVLFLSIFVSVFIALNLQFLMDVSFTEMVFYNKQQQKLLSFSFLVGPVSFYGSVAALICITVFGVKLGITNPNLFIIFASFYFSAVLILIPPMSGWYYWIIPFFSYFFSRESNRSLYLFFAMTVLYFIYFYLSNSIGYYNVITNTRIEFTIFNDYAVSVLSNEVMLNLTFTILQTSLVLLCVQVLSAGLLRYRHERISGKPFLMGVGGNSGVGKTVLGRSVEAIFGLDNTTIIYGDDRHKWKRGALEWKSITHLNPKANLLHSEIDSLRALRTGKKVFRKNYDHQTGTFTENLAVVPKRVIMLEGLHPFYLKAQRDLFDLRVFIDPEKDLADHWKICRDKSKRNYTTEKVMSQICDREADYKKYIISQRPHADFIISPKADRKIIQIGETSAEFQIEYDVFIENSASIDRELRLLSNFDTLELEHEFEDIDYQRVTLRGDLSQEQTRRLLDDLDDRLQEVEAIEPQLPVGLYGAVMYLLVAVILREAKTIASG